MKAVSRLSTLAAVLCCAHSTAAQLGSTREISSQAKKLATRLMEHYEGNGERSDDDATSIPGLFPDDSGNEIYFWQDGVFMSQMIDYWHLTGDDTYNDAIQTGMLHQMGEDENFLPANQTRSMGNDDQCYWALAAMTAVESGFQENNDDPSWLDLAKAVYSNEVERIDHDTCDGGLRWQVFNFNVGYDYKNTISNGCLMNLGARLARFTGEKKYTETVDELWDWLIDTGLIDEDTYTVYGGAETSDNCTEIDKVSFSDAASMISYTAAVMYNYTDGSDTWRERTTSLTERVLDQFFKDGVAFEQSCEVKRHNCNNDQMAFKGLLHRYLAASTQVAPFLASNVLPTLKTSAKAAIDQCTGGKDGTKCGFYWSDGEYITPGVLGISEDMNVLSAVSNLLIAEAEGPATSSSGGGNSDDSGEDDESDDGDSPSSTESEGASETGSDDAAETTDSGDSAAGYVGVSKITMVLAGCGLMVSSFAGLL